MQTSDLSRGKQPAGGRQACSQASCPSIHSSMPRPSTHPPLIPAHPSLHSFIHPFIFPTPHRPTIHPSTHPSIHPHIHPLSTQSASQPASYPANIYSEQTRLWGLVQLLGNRKNKTESMCAAGVVTHREAGTCSRVSALT